MKRTIDMMKITTTIFLTVLGLLCCGELIAQNKPYRDASNPYYWKNRKPYEGYWQQDVAYKIKATIDDKTDIVDGAEELTYYNNSPDTLHFLYFHLYQNAFIKGGYLEQLNLENNFKQQFGKYEADGKGTTIESITVVEGGYAVTPVMDFSIMRVDLQQPVLPNQSVTLQIKFKTYFDDGGNQRRRMKMFKDKWGNKQYDGVHWYPRICVYDKKFGWETDQHLGKEFYGDFGSYDVELTFPNHYILDATGELQNRDEVLPAELRAKLDIKNFKDKPWEEQPSVVVSPDGTTKTWKFKSINTHDFAWVADPTFRIGEATVTLNNGDRVSCISLAQEPHARGWQDAAAFTAKVIGVYSNDIGNYAYPKMIVADARDGMEYPMLTLDNGMSPGYYGLLAHEVGHNWFFGMVGNNETYRASLDEGFTQFLTNWSMTSILGETKPTRKNPNPQSRLDGTAYWGYIRDAMKEQDAPINTHSDDFGGALGHGGGYGHVYYKTATMLYNLQYVLGDSLFIGAMQYYFNQWKMAHPYFDDFRNSVTAYTHVDLNWFFDQWMETTKRIDYAVGEPLKLRKVDTSSLYPKNVRGVEPKQLTLSNNQDYYKIRFERLGEMQMPLDFAVLTKDLQVLKYIIPNTYFVKDHDTETTVLPEWRGWGVLNPTYDAIVSVPKGTTIKNVMIDPTYRLADINQLNNSTQFPVYFGLDNLKTDASDRKHYTLNWRPDVWYNSIDGVKAGVNFNGHYLNDRMVFSSTIWYNTTLANDYSGDAENPMNIAFRFKDRIAKNLYQKFELRSLDGLTLVNAGVECNVHDWVIDIYFKGFYRDGSANLDYLLYPTSWNADRQNNSINIDMTLPYQYYKGSGSYKMGLRASAFSDYDYSRLYVQWLNHHTISKFELHTRTYAQILTGTNIAPESQLNLAGANSEEMMENKFIRSRAFVPTSWLGYGDNVNHFHAGGGLNIRGYAGYLVPVNTNGTQVHLYTGNNGAAFNAELDFDKFIPLNPRRLHKYFHFDTYLFGDVGVLQSKYNAGEYGLTKETTAATTVMASVGAGVAFTIKKWFNYDEVKPFTLRFDMPLFLNNTPYVDGSYAKFRWVIGVNRAF